jgi:CRP-like cAMP-binding protein
MPIIAPDLRWITKVQLTGQMIEVVEIFESVSLEDLEALAKRLRWKRYGANQQIISHLDESTNVFLVIEGMVRVTVYSPAGKEVTFRDIAAGEYFGELAAIDGLSRSATVAALTDSLVASMSSEIFWEILRTYPDVAALVLKRLASSVRALTERVFEFSALAVRNRVHAELLRLARHHMVGDNAAMIQPAPTHADLASRISTHREAVTRELNQLSRDGLVERRAGALAIHNVKQLARMVQNAIVL